MIVGNEPGTSRRRFDEVTVYAGMVRAGGGLTVVSILVDRLVHVLDVDVRVLVGDERAFEQLSLLAAENPRVSIARFMIGASASLRSVASKVWALMSSLAPRGRRLVVTVNFWLPTRGPLLVYHLNLLNFTDGGGWGKRLRDLDARLACRRADMNVFESRYLMERAQASVEGAIHEPSVMYVGFDPEFQRASTSAKRCEGTLAMISSVQPHKDNDTCIDVLSELVSRAPEIDWRLRVFGGQSAGQWATVKQYAHAAGVGDRVSFEGPVSKAALAEVLSGCTCLIGASRVESFYMVALEAMACACPVVLVEATSAVESVGDAALLAPPGHSSVMADHVLALATRAEFREEYVRRGLQRCERFSEDILRKDLAHLLASQ